MNNSNVKKLLFKNPLDEKIEIFVSKLSATKIYDFVEECKKRHLQSKIKETENKISFQIFSFIMKHIWSDKIEEFNIIEHLLEIIFNRFKAVKCLINTENYNNTNNNNNNLNINSNEDTNSRDKRKKDNSKSENYYYISDLNTDDKEVDVYEIALVLTIFMKCSFREKIEVMFNITDVDNDGYINQKEVTKLIHTVNYIFADEQSPIMVKSSLISQSLASIKAKNILNQILYSPGNLIETIRKEKYILFDDLIKAIEKIPNYKFSILPKINILESLSVKKKEPEINVNKKDIKEFLSITSDILQVTKETTNYNLNSNQFNLNTRDTGGLIGMNNNSNINNMNNINTCNLISLASSNNILLNKIKETGKKNIVFPKIDSKNKPKSTTSIFTTQVNNLNTSNISATKTPETNTNLGSSSQLNYKDEYNNYNNAIANTPINTKDQYVLLNKNNSAIKNNKKAKDKKHKHQNNNLSDFNNEIKIGYEKLNNIELQPGIFKIKDSIGKSLTDPERKYVPISKILNNLEYYSFKKVSDFDNQIDEMIKQKKNVTEQFSGVKERIKGPSRRIHFSLSFLTHQAKEYRPKKN